MSSTGPDNDGNDARPDSAAPQPPPAPPEPEGSGGRDRQTNQWAMFIHFSILAGWVVPLAGLILPILLWQVKKDELPGIVPHAHVVMNWIVTSLVYGAICFVLTFLFIGLLGFLALGIATVVFAIIGGIKANEGEVWEYPGTIVKVFK